MILITFSRLIEIDSIIWCQFEKSPQECFLGDGFVVLFTSTRFYTFTSTPFRKSVASSSSVQTSPRHWNPFPRTNICPRLWTAADQIIASANLEKTSKQPEASTFCCCSVFEERLGDQKTSQVLVLLQRQRCQPTVTRSSGTIYRFQSSCVAEKEFARFADDRNTPEQKVCGDRRRRHSHLRSNFKTALIPQNTPTSIKRETDAGSVLSSLSSETLKGPTWTQLETNAPSRAVKTPPAGTGERCLKLSHFCGWAEDSSQPNHSWLLRRNGAVWVSFISFGSRLNDLIIGLKANGACENKQICSTKKKKW